MLENQAGGRAPGAEQTSGIVPVGSGTGAAPSRVGWMLMYERRPGLVCPSLGRRLQHGGGRHSAVFAHGFRVVFFVLFLFIELSSACQPESTRFLVLDPSHRLVPSSMNASIIIG